MTPNIHPPPLSLPLPPSLICCSCAFPKNSPAARMHVYFQCCKIDGNENIPDDKMKQNTESSFHFNILIRYKYAPLSDVIISRLYKLIIDNIQS